MTYPPINTQETINLSDLRDIFKYYVSSSVKGEECHDDIGIMVYANIKFLHGRLVKIAEVIGDIRTKSERLKITDKNELSACYFSVAGFNGSKDKENVTSHTGLIVFDIDKKDNPSLDFVELKRALNHDKFIYAYFSSPNGGVKIVVNTTVNVIEQHESYYYCIVDYLYQRYTQITKIDTTGVNVNRACYLPYDDHAYFNPHAHRYCLTDEQILKSSSVISRNKAISSSNILTLVPEFISYDEHYGNIYNLIKKRTSVGLLSSGADEEKRTSVGLLNNSRVDEEKRTDVPLQGVINNEYRTLVGLYDNVFNKYRYHKIEQVIMSTNVPFLDLLILKHMQPVNFKKKSSSITKPSADSSRVSAKEQEINLNNGLDYTTRLDEYYFKESPQEAISLDSIDGLEGLEVCEVVITKDTVIKEHFRAKTLGSITMKLIFNNPFCHPEYILKEVLRINDYFCEDPHPVENPKPDEVEVSGIVLNNYQKFIEGTLDFSSVIRKKHKHGKVSKKYVFFSRLYENENKKEKHREAIRTFQDGRKKKICQKYLEAIHALKDGSKITQKRIADYMGMTTRSLRRHDTKSYDDLIKNYNDTLKRKV